MNVPTRFIDTGYWIAFVDERDEYHGRALQLARDLPGPFVTTEAVLTELGNSFATARWRGQGMVLLQRIRSAHHIEVASVTAELFARAVELYIARPDREWGLTDCISFVVMRDRGVSEALAVDQHIVQAGFRALLREA